MNQHARPQADGRPAAAVASRRRPLLDRAVEAMPLVAVVLIAALMGSLVWLADRTEREEQRKALIRDALWVEQALRFQIAGGREMVERLALDIADGALSPDAVAGRLRSVVAAHPEIAQIEWRDAVGSRLMAIPADPPGDAGRPEPATPVAGGVMGVVRDAGPRGRVVDLTVPIQHIGRPAGTLAALIRLDRLLAQHVPWWITQNNLVALADRDGGELATKSSIDPEPGAPRHAISFDPPLPGVVLQITATSLRSSFTQNVLVASIFGLAVVAALSIFALTRHYRHRLAAETSLGEALALRKAMENSLTVGMRARDLDGRIIYVNPAFCRMVGLAAEDLVGRRPPMPYWVPNLVDETLARHAALARGDQEPSSFETRFRRADGTPFDVLVYEAPLIDSAGAHRGWMGSIIDVTDRKRAEALEQLQAETLARTGRLVSMGEMASTISHELNQPLAAIAGYGAGCLNLIRSGRFDAAELAEALEKLDAQARRAGAIVRRVHDLVRKREPKFGPVDIAALIHDVAGFVAPDARKAGVRIEAAAAGDLPAVEADRILIEQVVLNLLRNGIEAMAGAPAPQRRLDLTAALAVAGGRRSVAIEVADRGGGIDAAVAGRLFSPFVTTKPEGMGMGLNICRSIVELHQGRLTHAARPGGGTVFAVELPAAAAEAAAE